MPPASQSPQERHAALVLELEAHNYRYYVLDDPAVTDAAFDALMRKLRALEAEHPELVTKLSPTQRVAGEVRVGTTKVKHENRMFSLDNAYSFEDLREFKTRIEGGLRDGETVDLVVEPKLDGASVEAVYENGALVLASTRGDGETGEDITQNLRATGGVPLTIPHKGKITLRGEVVLFRRDLEAVNAERAKEGLEPFANPRNAAAGSIRMLDAREVHKRRLRAVFYSLVEGSELHTSHAESLIWMATQGLPTHRREVVTPWAGVEKAITAIDEARNDYPFETDGAVVKVDSYRLQDTLGFTSKFPKWAIAYKFAAERASTIVREIVVQVGRTGTLTPVAVLDPVELGGTTVSRASLHNADQIAVLGVRIGDRVLIEKAGEIIPQVISVETEHRSQDSAPFTMPTTCPICGTAVTSRLREEDKPELGTGAAIRCPNRACPAQVKAQIFYFARRFAMDVDHLGVALVEQLVDRKIIKDVADLYTLSAKQIGDLERMGDKSAKNVHDSIELSKNRTLDRLLCGLGIPQIGQVAARQLAEEAGTLETMLAWNEEQIREHVGHIRGFGPKMVESVVQFLEDTPQRRIMEKLVERGVGRPQPREIVATSGPLVGTSFCVTGVLSRKRDDVHADLRAAGAEIHDSVKKTTTYLVSGDKTGKSKLDQAKKFGTRVLTEPQMEALLVKGRD